MRTARASTALAALLTTALLAPPALGQTSPSGRLDSLLREAQGAAQAGDYTTAERLFERAVAADPRSPEAACGLGQTHMARRQFPEAVEALESCQRLVLARLRRLSAEQQASYAQADQEIRELYDTMGAIRSGRAMQSDPGLLDRISNRIRELEELKTRERVRVEVPAPILLALGTAYFQTGAPEEAEQALLAALKIEPGSGEAHRTLATVYLAQGRFEEAEERVRLAEGQGVVVSAKTKADIAARRSPGVPAATVARTPRATRPEDEAVTIHHAGRTCAANGVFVHLEARVTPSWGVHDPVVRFRSEEAADWYAMVMLPAGGDTFATTLPKPRGAESFDYYIEVSSYDDEATRTEEFRVTVTDEREECGEAATDPEEPGGVLIVDVPRDVGDVPPVPPGFSIRGTANDVGVFEMGSNKALVFGGIAAAGAAAAGIAVASQPAEPYSGPEPFVDAPGIAFVASNPPPGSTLSLSSGSISLELRIHSLETMMGARVTVDLAQSSWGYSSCVQLTTTHDLSSGRTESVVLSGPTRTHGEPCNIDHPIELLQVRVTRADGLGGFRTGAAPLGHLRILYQLSE